MKSMRTVVWLLAALLVAHALAYFASIAVFGYSPDRALLLNYLLK